MSKSTLLRTTIELRSSSVEVKYAKLLAFAKQSMDSFNEEAMNTNNEDRLQNMFGMLALEIEQQLREINEFVEPEEEFNEEEQLEE